MNPKAEIAVICVTRNGRDLEARLSALLPGCDCYVPESLCSERTDRISFAPPLSHLVEKIWGHYRSLIFIMAVGIVVRVIAPHIKDKRTDPAVLVMDEKAEHVISLLSGHLGGANDLTLKVAERLGADPVITTATDLSGLPAVELWAKERELIVENPDAVTGVNAALVNGGRVGIYIQAEELWREMESPWERFDNLQGLIRSDCQARVIVSNRNTPEVEQDKSTLFLRPTNLVLGIGCNRGTSRQEMREFITRLFDQEGLSLRSVGRITSIEQKRDEAGLLEFAGELGVSLVFYTAHELNAMPDGSGFSEWAHKELGVKGVCEQAAMKGAGRDSLVIPKAISGNVTAAVAESRGHSLSSV